MKAPRNKGFSLFELMVVMVVLAIIVPPLLYLLMFGFRIQDEASNLWLATSAAESKMEALIAAGYPSLAVGTATEPATPEPGFTRVTTIADKRAFVPPAAVTADPHTGRGGEFFVVTVSVSRSGRELIRLVRIFADNPEV